VTAPFNKGAQNNKQQKSQVKLKIGKYNYKLIKLTKNGTDLYKF